MTKKKSLGRPQRKRLPLEQRRKLVLEAAVKMMGERQGNEVTVVGIARELGWSVPAVTRCYRYRSDIINALLDFAEESLLKLYGEVRARYPDDGRAFARELFIVFHKFTELNPGFVQVLTGRAFGVDEPELMKRLLSLHDRWERWFREALKLGILNEQLPVDYDATARAAVLMQVLNGLWTRYAIETRHHRLSRIYPAVEALMKP